MGITAHLKDVVILSSILSLFIVGLIITLKSGVVAMDRHRTRQVLSNFTRMVVAVAGCLAFLMMVQQIVGIRIGSHW